MYSELSLILIKMLSGQCDIRYGYLAYVNGCHMTQIECSKLVTSYKICNMLNYHQINI